MIIDIQCFNGSKPLDIQFNTKIAQPIEKEKIGLESLDLRQSTFFWQQLTVIFKNRDYTLANTEISNKDEIRLKKKKTIHDWTK